MLALMISAALSGLLVGAIARLALPGKDPMSIWATMGIGVAGSLVAGIVVYLITGGTYAAGLTLSILCATALMYLVRRSRGGGIMDPGDPGRVRR